MKFPWIRFSGKYRNVFSCFHAFALCYKLWSTKARLRKFPNAENYMHHNNLFYCFNLNINPVCLIPPAVSYKMTLRFFAWICMKVQVRSTQANNRSGFSKCTFLIILTNGAGKHREKKWIPNRQYAVSYSGE